MLASLVVVPINVIRPVTHLPLDKNPDQLQSPNPAILSVGGYGLSITIPDQLIDILALSK